MTLICTGVFSASFCSPTLLAEPCGTAESVDAAVCDAEGSVLGTDDTPLVDDDPFEVLDVPSFASLLARI
jgi:hypothetical protein